MADCILELMNNRELYQRYAKKAKKRIKDFEIEAIIKKWQNIID